MVEIYCIVSGQVQGVRYRDYAQGAAGELGLTGWAKNLSDGTVEICAQGLPDQLKAFVEHLHEGSLHAKVEAVSVDWRSPKEVLSEFSIVF